MTRKSLSGLAVLILVMWTIWQNTTSSSSSVPTTTAPTATPLPQVLAGTTQLTTSLTATTSSKTYIVEKVVDGDTIKVRVGGQLKTVRLVGINTPETVDPRKPVECMGQAASDRLKQLLTGTEVSLETDPTQADQDRYGRWLRFVFLPDGTDVGQQLLEEGLAQEALYSDTPHRYRAEYLLAQSHAQQLQSGLWQPGVCPQ